MILGKRMSPFAPESTRVAGAACVFGACGRSRSQAHATFAERKATMNQNQKRVSDLRRHESRQMPSK